MPSASINEKQAQLVGELSLFEDWQTRYEYVISLGKQLPPIEEKSRISDNLIKGCQSQVWLDAQINDLGKICYYADSDSLITKGIIALFIYLLDKQSIEAIIQSNLNFIKQTDLKNHLAPSRANALYLMPQEMKARALALLSKKG